MAYVKMIDWDTFREMCKFAIDKKCTCPDVPADACSLSNRGAKDRCIFWKGLNNLPKREEKNERNESTKPKKFKEIFQINES